MSGSNSQGITERKSMENEDSKNCPKALYIVDISSLFFRSYYAISSNMTNQKGLPTNALYGTVKMIQQLCRKKAPDYLICCFDSKEPSFRKSLYPEYKANRGEMPEDLEAQAPYLKKLISALLIPSWQKPGFEADDLIASLTRLAQKQNFNCCIVSSDKDFTPLVNKNVRLYDTMKDRLYDTAGVEAKWGLPPDQMQDYLSLVGDASDNIPGVRGIGPKSAIALLKSYKSLEGVYNNLNHIKKAQKEKLIQNKEMAFLSRKLVSLKEDLIWEGELEDMKYKNFSAFSYKDKQTLKQMFEELDFKSLLKKFFPVKTESPKPFKDVWRENKNIPLPFENSGFPQGKKTGKLKQEEHKPNSKIKPAVTEDFKNNLPPYASVWIGAFQDQFYLAGPKQFIIVSERELKSLASFLDHKWVRYSGHDLKHFWRKLEIQHPIAQWDSLIASYLLGSASFPFRKLLNKSLSLSENENLNVRQIIYQEQKLKEELENRLKKEDLTELFQNIELPLISVLYNMERQGILLDLEEVKQQSQSLSNDIKELDSHICQIAGEQFNLSSPKQLAHILFEKLKLPQGRKTKTGFSTDSHELIKIQKLHPILPLLLERRELFKLKNSYVDNLILLRNKKTGRIHTEFKQATVSTGRLASAHPNLQNIPIRTPRGRLIRKAFIAPENKQLISADYSQIELRILAHLTEDPSLCKAFEQDLDIHAATASEIFNVPLKEVSEDLRRKGKGVNFGIIYGQGAYGLSESLFISRTEAKEIIDNYFKKFKKIKDYIETVKESLSQKGYVKTLYGRKRFFESSALKLPRQRAGLERAAVNAPLQGTASDLVKKAMIRLDESLPIPLLSQVHDELLFECPTESAEREIKEILSIMEDCPELKVPLKAQTAKGKNWFSAHC